LLTLIRTVEWLAIQTSTNLYDWQSITTNRVSGDNNIIAIPVSPSNPAQFFRAFALPQAGLGCSQLGLSKYAGEPLSRGFGQ
jgi:hypothetical protein